MNNNAPYACITTPVERRTTKNAGLIAEAGVDVVVVIVTD
jgi:hypothetical protein